MKGIKYVAPLGSSGYAEAAKTYMLELNKIVPVTWKQLVFDVPNPNLSNKDTEANKLVNRNIEVDTLLVHCTPDNWSHLIDEETQSFKKIIGQTVWETTAIHPHWVECCNDERLSEIWVPTAWNKNVFIESGVTTPIKVVPHLYEKEKVYDCKIEGVREKDLVFYTIGQWSERKGISDTLKAFCEAFTEEDDVCLVLKTFKSSYNEQEIETCREWIHKILSNYVYPPRVIYIPNECTKEQIFALHNLGHVYLSLCKAEGWGLGAFEAASVGNIVVTTNFGATPSFLLEGNSFFIDYTLVPVSGMEWIKWYIDGQKWAKPVIENAVEVLKYILSHKQYYMKENTKLRKHIENNYSGKKILTKKLLNA